MGEELTIRVVFSSGRPGREPETLQVPEGTSLREVLRKLALPVEGCALFWGGESVPSDLRLEQSGELEVVSTFSGG